MEMRTQRRLCAAAIIALLGGCATTGQTSAGATGALKVSGHFHRVTAGETLAGLAGRFGVAVVDLEELNQVDRRNAKIAGRTIFIPAKNRRSQTASAKSPQHSRLTAAPGAKANRSTSPPKGGQKSMPKRSRLQWPVSRGALSSKFGHRGGRPHEGIDIAAPAGTAILAAEDGKVIYAGAGVRGYGKMVIVRHRGELVTVYAHNRRNLVQMGTLVQRGQVIAEVGRTGRTSGNHLHFEVRTGEKPRDPLRYVRPPKAAKAARAESKIR